MARSYFLALLKVLPRFRIAIGIIRLEPDSLVQRLERGLHLAGLAKDFAAGAEGAGPVGILGDDGIDFGQRLAGLAAVMQRSGAGNRGVEPVALRRRRIVDQRGAAFDQLRGLGGRKRRADDRRLGGRCGLGAGEVRIATVNAAVAANGETNDRMIGSSI